MTNRRAKARETSGSRRAVQAVWGCRYEQEVSRRFHTLGRVERQQLPAARWQMGRSMAVAVVAVVKHIGAMRRVIRTMLVGLDNKLAGVEAFQSAG